MEPSLDSASTHISCRRPRLGGFARALFIIFGLFCAWLCFVYFDEWSFPHLILVFFVYALIAMGVWPGRDVVIEGDEESMTIDLGYGKPRRVMLSEIESIELIGNFDDHEIVVRPLRGRPVKIESAHLSSGDDFVLAEYLVRNTNVLIDAHSKYRSLVPMSRVKVTPKGPLFFPRGLRAALAFSAIPILGAWVSFQSASRAAAFGATTWELAGLVLIPLLFMAPYVARLSRRLVALLMLQVVMLFGLHDLLYEVGCIAPYDRWVASQDVVCHAGVAAGIGWTWLVILSMSVIASVRIAHSSTRSRFAQ